MRARVSVPEVTMPAQPAEADGMLDDPGQAVTAPPGAGSRRGGVQSVLVRIGESAFGLLFAALLLLILVSIIGRNVGHGLPWWLDAAQLLFVYLALIGGVVSYGSGDAISFTEVLRRLPEPIRQLAEGLSVGAVLGLSALECYAATQATVAVQGQVSTTASIPSVLYSAPFAVAFLLWALIALVHALRVVRGVLPGIGLLVGLVIVGVPSLPSIAAGGGLETTQSLGYAFLFMLLLLLAGTPLSFVLLAGAYLTNALTAFSSQELPIDLVSATGDVLLLAIPFFIFVGYLLTDGTLSRPLTRFFDALVGHLPGGKNLVALISMFVFSGISGSKIADVAAVSVSLRGILDDEPEDDDRRIEAARIKAEALEAGHGDRSTGGRPGERTGLLCGAAVAGETIPPSLVLLVLGSVTSLSITKLFLAGIAPAAMMFVLIALYATFVAIRGRRDGQPRQRWVGLRPTFSRGVLAIPALLIPVILLLGIGVGLTTPLEASVVAVAYALVLTSLGSRSRIFQVVTRVSRHTTRFGGSILILILFAVPLARQITLSTVADGLAQFVNTLGGGKVVFLVISVGALVVFGQLLEGLPAILLFGPILMPLATQFHVSPFQYAILLSIGLGLGAFSPPFGVGLYSTVTIEETTLAKAIRPWGRYMSVVLLGVVIVAVFPPLSTFLPNLLG